MFQIYVAAKRLLARLTKKQGRAPKRFITDKQTFGCCRIASTLKNFVQNHTMLINRTPQPEFTTLNRDNDFVQMPDIARLRLSATWSSRNIGPEFCNPSTDCFV